VAEAGRRHERRGSRTPRPLTKVRQPSGVDASESTETHGLDLERLVFFSDAVFAIAITLLIIELRLPPLPAKPETAEIVAALQSVLPGVFAYALSFATIGSYWLAHWRRYRYVERANERLAAMNLLLLGLVAFIPFPTALIGEHGDQPVIVVFYAASLSAAGVVGPLTWLYAWHAGLAVPGLSLRYATMAALRGFSVPIVMLGSLLLLPFAHPYVVEVAWVLIAPVQILLNIVLERSNETRGSPRQESVAGVTATNRRRTQSGWLRANRSQYHSVTHSAERDSPK